MSTSNLGWIDERIEQLKTLVAEGHSASQIAKIMGGVTRNAVIGKATRMGLQLKGCKLPVEKVNRNSHPWREPRTRKVAVKADTAKAAPVVKVPEKVSLTQALRKRLAETAFGIDQVDGCQWPVGRLYSAHRLCGGGKAYRSSYCTAHHRLAYGVEPRQRLALTYQPGASA
ncbi:GcrA family cell cycle regulator [Asticcacaulis sp. YBE204]|uniref:GcrA family cell cycle regulator n=1 Tax=Asticcacaulis sp. YBE204 TaxID=1282363 RepID=UPI0003C40A29|nr:GcrA family cell cycle regulator [Asticcacaulis sp. YBE204]ESQ78487.1 hypothetical protein AEYBE204_13110 [Asticcacaulis sp. YBE204]